MSTFVRFWQLAALDNLDCLCGLVPLTFLNVLNLAHDIPALQDFSKDNVFAIKPAIRPSKSMLITDRLPVTYFVMAVVIKNWEPFVSLPALAILSIPFLLCFNLKFSSSNLFPYIDFPPVPTERVSLFSKSFSPDGCFTISIGKVSALNHEVFDHTMEG